MSFEIFNLFLFLCWKFCFVKKEFPISMISHLNIHILFTLLSSSIPFHIKNQILDTLLIFLSAKLTLLCWSSFVWKDNVKLGAKSTDREVVNLVVKGKKLWWSLVEEDSCQKGKKILFKKKKREWISELFSSFCRRKFLLENAYEICFETEISLEFLRKKI